MQHFLGVDIGATTVKLGLIDESGAIIGSRRDYDSQARSGPDATMNVIADAAPQLLRDNGIDPRSLVAVGACSPTPVSAEGLCIFPTNIDSSWEGVNVKEKLALRLGVPAFLLNDGDAAAYREYAVRVAGGDASRCMAQFITGTGLGGSLIIDGEVFAGPIMGNELGHVVTDTSDTADRCGCGAMGCAETRASLTGLANLVRRYQERQTPIAELEGNPDTVARALRRLVQDPNPLPEVQAIWREYFVHIGRAARSVANVVGCDLIVISGGAQEREKGADASSWRRFLDTGLSIVTDELRQSFPHLSRVRVEWATDEVPDSAAYGAAAYAAHAVTVR